MEPGCRESQQRAGEGTADLSLDGHPGRAQPLGQDKGLSLRRLLGLQGVPYPKAASTDHFRREEDKGANYRGARRTLRVLCATVWS